MTLKADLPPSALTPREAARYLRMNCGEIYTLLHAGILRHYRQGRGYYIPIRVLDAYQDELVARTMGDANVRELRRS